MSEPRTTYPDEPAARDRWVVGLRGVRERLDPYRPYGWQIELERTERGALEPVLTVFLTNRECPWRCVMCDLWRYTLEETVPSGAIPAQIAYALAQATRRADRGEPAPAEPSWVADRHGAARPPVTLPRRIKLYNAGSFFDPHAIPLGDYPAIARLLEPFERVVVESHPALVNERCLSFRDQLAGRLEIAMGLETAHPDVLARLNKRLTLERFMEAAAFLRQYEIALRVFLLVQPPFLPPEETLAWTVKSVDFALAHGAEVVVLIPTRPGNGALDELRKQGLFTPPRLATLERAMEATLPRVHPPARVFADLWDLERFSTCPHCFAARRARLERMNHAQQTRPPVRCPHCSEM